MDNLFEIAFLTRFFLGAWGISGSLIVREGGGVEYRSLLIIAGVFKLKGMGDISKSFKLLTRLILGA